MCNLRVYYYCLYCPDQPVGGLYYRGKLKSARARAGRSQVAGLSVAYLLQPTSSKQVLYLGSMAFTANVPPSLRGPWWTLDARPASRPVDTTADFGGCSFVALICTRTIVFFPFCFLLPHALFQSLNNLISEIIFLVHCCTPTMVVFSAYECHGSLFILSSSFSVIRRS